MSSNALWKSKLGFILAASGSAVGLGNIWKFPYMVSQYGGGAFLFLYIICVALIGYPLLVSEVIIGRKSRLSPIHAYENKNTFWRLPGIAAFIGTTIVISYYMVIAGWALKYLAHSILGGIDFSYNSGFDYGGFFTEMLGSHNSLVFYTFIFFVLTIYFVLKGINSGIEKLNSYAMPTLFIILILLAVKAITLDGGSEALSYLFTPDFSKIDTAVVIAALGQSFFSLSIGSGAIIIYATYLTKKENILKSSAYTAGLDTFVGVLAAMIVVPIVFSFGQDLGAGPGLTFVTLPHMFGSMMGGKFFAILFFLLLGLAALTSTVSLLEAVSVMFKEIVKNKVTRVQSIIVMSAITFVMSIFQAGAFNIFSDFTMFGGKNIFDISDYLSSNILYPLAGLLTAIYIGYFMPKNEFIKELHGDSNLAISTKIMFMLSALLRYVIPVVVFVVMLSITGLISF